MKHLRFSRDPSRNEVSEEGNITARQLFSAFRRSNEGSLMLSGLIRKQLYLCPLCKSSITKDEYEVDHVIPIVLIPSWKPYLVTSESNLMVLCKGCNKTKSSRLEGYYRLVFHRESYSRGPLYSKDIYKDYTKVVKMLASNKCKDKELQQMWNRDIVILNLPITQVIEKRLVLEVEVINED